MAQRSWPPGGVGGGREAQRAWGPRALAALGEHTAGAGQRPPAKPVPAGCSFGGKVYALDETWHPDLGEPFGVMRCVLCACETVSDLNPLWPRPSRVRERRGSAYMPFYLLKWLFSCPCHNLRPPVEKAFPVIFS